jgi:hypothetical protein
MHFKFSFECTIRKGQEDQEGLELSGIQQLLVYAGDFNILDENTNTVN